MCVCVLYIAKVTWGLALKAWITGNSHFCMSKMISCFYVVLITESQSRTVWSSFIDIENSSVTSFLSYGWAPLCVGGPLTFWRILHMQHMRSSGDKKKCHQRRTETLTSVQKMTMTAVSENPSFTKMNHHTFKSREKWNHPCIPAMHFFQNLVCLRLKLQSHFSQ